MAKCAHADDGAEATASDAFSPSRRRELSDENGDEDGGGGSEELNSEAVDMVAVGTTPADAGVVTHAMSVTDDSVGIVASRPLSRDEQKEDESDAFQEELELSAVFADSHPGDGGESDAHGTAIEAVREATVSSSEPTQGGDDDRSASATGTSSAPASPTLTPMVIAPMFAPVHRSWEAFEQSLKEYSQSTFQQYVIRTTTSVKRRNQRITENASSSSSSSLPPAIVQPSAQRSLDDNDRQDTGVSGEGDDALVEEQSTIEGAADGSASTTTVTDAVQDASSPALASKAPETAAPEAAVEQQQLIPESYHWYSKTLMCTHGWKDRNRGSGKRSLSVVRSTSCPAKMCVTLQHRGKGDEGWQVVLTRHVRTHNHQLSKELYLYYMENRRIYDPDLLLVAGALSASGSAARPLHQQQRQQQQQQRSKSGLSHLLTSSGSQQQHSQSLSMFGASGSRQQAAGSRPRAGEQIGFQAQRALVKVHDSWDAFHAYIAEYSAVSSQFFRARSTVSVVAKNLKTKSLALKADRSAEDVASQLVPEHERWYSKMLICNHGWKRKSRSKAPTNSHRNHDGSHDELTLDSACPAMLMARLQRDVNDTWRVMINRQVLDHNHPPLKLLVSGGAASSIAAAGQRAVSSSSSSVETLHHLPNASSRHTALHYFGTADLSGSMSDSQDLVDGDEDAAGDPGRQQQQRLESHHEFVVRVPKLESVHTSWEAFHARLQEYSNATFQLYRTRTTSSVQGRNQKIPELKRTSSSDVLSTAITDAQDEQSGSKLPSDTRTIPEEWKWYSKTLTCTHGWKERRRGTGKRTVQVFRSTACPVKICATVQFVEDGTVIPDADEVNGVESSGGNWRVVVTKHVVDHNHNLSKELQQHYSENRRIYDPELLMIDESNASVVTKPRKQHHSSSSSFLLGSSPEVHHHHHAFHQHPHPGGTEPSGASAQGLQSVNALHPFALLGDASLHPAGQVTTSAADAAFSSSTSNNSSSSSGLPASLTAYSGGAFPPLAGFRTSTQQQQQQQQQQNPPPFLFQAHQYFAVEQASANLGFAAPSHFQMPVMTGTGGNGDSTDAYSMGSSGSASSGAFLAAASSCRVHGHGGSAMRQSEVGMLQCTCFRGANVSIAKAPTSARPRPRISAASASSAPLTQARSAAKQKRTRDDAELQHDALDGNGDDDDEECEDEDAPSAGSGGAVWAPSQDPEILTLTSNAGVTLWRAPRIKRLHATWDAFQEHLEAYSVATFQLFRVRTTSSVSSRNTRIAQQAADRETPSTSVAASGSADDGDGDGASVSPPPPAPLPPSLVPDSYHWYSKTFVCTHGWKERRRGKGQRISHSLRSTACSAKLCVTLQRVLHEPSKWHVVVTRQGTDHNHEISEQAYQQYSEVRRIKDPSLLVQAEELWKKGMTRRKIYEFLKEHAPNALLMKDVHNLVQRWQQKHGKVASSSDGVAIATLSAEPASVLAASEEMAASGAAEPSHEDPSAPPQELQAI